MMKNRLSFFVSVILFPLLLSACGANANEKAAAAPSQPQQQTAAPPPAAPQPEQNQPAPVVEQKQQPVKQKADVVLRPSRTRRAESRPPVEPSQPARPAAPVVTESASASPRTINLPAPETPSIATPAPPPDELKPERIEAPAVRQVTVPSGTLVAVRMIDAVDSDTAHLGETFKASLDDAIVVDGEVVFPKGAEAYVKLASVQSAGRVSGRSEVQLQLDRIFLGDKSYVTETDKHVETGASQSGRTARSAGLGAALGAAIGAISGGGKGAVIGGVTGAGAGAGVEAIRKGDSVRVGSETRLEFRLEDSLPVVLQQRSSSPTSLQRNHPSGPERLGTSH